MIHLETSYTRINIYYEAVQKSRGKSKEKTHTHGASEIGRGTFVVSFVFEGRV